MAGNIAKKGSGQITLSREVSRTAWGGPPMNPPGAGGSSAVVMPAAMCRVQRRRTARPKYTSMSDSNGSRGWLKN